MKKEKKEDEEGKEEFGIWFAEEEDERKERGRIALRRAGKVRVRVEFGGYSGSGFVEGKEEEAAEAESEEDVRKW